MHLLAMCSPTQLADWATCNPKVTGSIPAPASSVLFIYLLIFRLFTDSCLPPGFGLCTGALFAGGLYQGSVLLWLFF